MDDIGYAVWKHLNLGLVELAPQEQGRRVGVMATAYGVASGASLIEAIERAQERMKEIVEAAPAGAGRDETLAQNRQEREWMRANGSLLLA